MWPPSTGALTGIAFILLGLAGVILQPIIDEAKLTAPAPTPIVTDRNGAFLTQIGHTTKGNGEQRIDYGYWPLASVPDRVARATLALEDRRFADHPGIDPLAIIRAAWRNMRGKHRSGASTIAMQVARMKNPAPRTFASKLRESVTAIALTMRYGRADVLAHYLRLVPYGNNSHGIAHAARLYFDKPVDDLSWAEIALLAAIPQSPTLTNPLNPTGLARGVKRGHRALDELARQSVLTTPEAALAHRQLAAMRAPPFPRRPDILHAALRYEALADSGRLRVDANDPRLTATLDLAMQADVAALARKALRGWRGSGAEQTAVLVVERATGKVRAAVGSGDYRDPHGGAIDFSATARSPGSTLKPFIYALALERGIITPADTLADLPEGASAIGNADGQFLGPMLPRQALANSRNVPATNLLRRTGLEQNFAFLHALGLHGSMMAPENFGLSMAIGALPTSLEKLVRAYSALANDGRLVDLTWVESQRVRAPLRVMSTDTARVVQSFLSDPLARLPTFSRYGPTEYPFPVALKTGTSQGYRDAWTIAWSKDLIVGVWLGRADAGPMARLSGASSAARLAQALLLKLTKTKPGDLNDAAFPAPPGREAVELCALGGRSNGTCGQTLTEWLKPEEVPAVVRANASSTTQPYLPSGEVARNSERVGCPASNTDDPTPALRADPPLMGGCRPTLAFPATQRAWAQNAGYRVTEAEDTPRLAITAPENETRLFINPDAPPQAGRIALKAVVSPKVPQVVWYVDGAPFSISDPDKPVWWPLTKGAHRFQVRLPLQKSASDVVRVTVE